jgi:hypothetical protein
LGEGVVLSFVGIEGFSLVGSGLAIAGFWIVSLSRSDLSVRDCRLAIVVATLGAQAISPTTTGGHLILSPRLWGILVIGRHMLENGSELRTATKETAWKWEHLILTPSCSNATAASSA